MILIGRGSFIAGHVAHAARQAGINTLWLSRTVPVQDVLGPKDAVINFAFASEYAQAPYKLEHDRDLQVAEIAQRLGARFIMLSSRRVYPENVRWGAKEGDDASGDDTYYGRGKAVTEAALRSIADDRTLILRLSNIIGFEYSANRQRKSFMGYLQNVLRSTGNIFYDIAPDSQRDFLPVEICAHSIIRVIQSGERGTFNIGCGFPISCTKLATWLLEGYGSGDLIIDNSKPLKRDSFFLDMNKWRAQFPALMTADELKNYVTALGGRLRTFEDAVP